MMLDLSQAAIHITEACADFARGALRALPYALPVLLFFLVDIKVRRLLAE